MKTPVKSASEATVFYCTLSWCTWIALIYPPIIDHFCLCIKYIFKLMADCEYSISIITRVTFEWCCIHAFSPRRMSYQSAQHTQRCLSRPLISKGSCYFTCALRKRLIQCQWVCAGLPSHFTDAIEKPNAGLFVEQLFWKAFLSDLFLHTPKMRLSEVNLHVDAWFLCSCSSAFVQLKSDHSRPPVKSQEVDETIALFTVRHDSFISRAKGSSNRR